MIRNSCKCDFAKNQSNKQFVFAGNFESKNENPFKSSALKVNFIFLYFECM